MHDNGKLKTVPDIWQFVALCFGPVILPVIGLACMMWLGAFFVLLTYLSGPQMMQAEYPKGLPLGEILEFAGGLLLPVLLVYLTVVCYRFYLRVSSWFKKGLIIYSFWMVIGFFASILFLTAIGSVSMAVADGVATPESVFLRYLSPAASMLLQGQALVIPWVFLSVLVMKRMSNKKAP